MWNAFRCCLSLIKSEYGRNVTLKRLENKRGRVGAGVRIVHRESEGRGGSLWPTERESRTNLPHVLLEDGVCRPRMS